jgi:signal transduction histidine kinase
VEDTGIGIRPEHQLRIFEPFQHLHKTGLKGEESTGLGLALVKRIADAHRGSVYVSSEEGEGIGVHRCSARFPGVLTQGNP